MVWGMVLYSDLGFWNKELEKIKQIFPDDPYLVLNNKAGQAGGGEIQGANEQFEFGGYLTLIESMLNHEGPYLILNDTLFRTHYSWGWRRLLNRHLTKWEEGDKVVLGDIRRDGDQYFERPDPFLASWIFIIPNKATLLVFREALKQVLSDDLVCGSSQEYKDFIVSWIQPKSKLRGWHGLSDSHEISRKMNCIMWEHGLSRRLLQSGVKLVGADFWSPYQYKILRIVDRFKTRLQVWLH